MKKLLLAGLLLFSLCAIAQDKIVMTNGTTVEGITILKVNKSSVQYREDATGKIRQPYLSRVATITYQGKVYEYHPVDETTTLEGQLRKNARSTTPTEPVTVTEKIALPAATQAMPVTTEPTRLTPTSPREVLYEQGRTDAGKYYRGYKGAGTGTFFTTFFLTPVGGFIVAIAASSSPPKPHTLMYPDAELWKNGAYSSGYTNQAFRIKRRKVWKNWGIGFLTLAVIGGVAYTATNGGF